jgi:DNA-directed RNA polymerase specialized sigma24 family protein
MCQLARSRHLTAGGAVDDLVRRAVAHIEGRWPLDSALGDRAAEALEPLADFARTLCRTELGGVPAAEDVAVAVLVELWDSGDPARLTEIAARRSRVARAQTRDVLAEDGVLDEMTPAHLAWRSKSLDERDRILDQASAAALDPSEYHVVRLRWREHRQRVEVAAALGLEVDEVTRVLDGCRGRMQTEILRHLDVRPAARRPRSRAS